MKLKQIPSDFIVRESSSVEVKDSGTYSYLKCTKTNRNTLDVVRRISSLLNIKEKEIGFAGTKDKHAVTEQMISIPLRKERVQNIEIDNVSLEFVGYGDKPITLGDLEGNHFEIVVRDVVEQTIEKISHVVNYFDEQRFSTNNKEIGKSIVKKDFKTAAELAECNISGNDYVGALKTIPLRLLKMYVHAYQSYLWNETVASLVEGKEVPYSLGTFVFGETDVEEVPLIGFTPVENVQKIMAKEGITHRDFIIKQIPELSMEGGMRKVCVPVENLSISDFMDDELNGGKKVVLSFTLGKGSYATMVVKQLFQ